MKKFKFKLQTVHDVREIRKENEHLALTKLQNEAADAEAKVGEIEKIRNEAIEQLSDNLKKKGQAINAHELEMSSVHINTLDRFRREAQQVLEIKKQECRLQSQKVADASRDVKITARLRENQAQKHEQEATREEQNLIDEIVSANYARKLTQTG